MYIIYPSKSSDKPDKPDNNLTSDDWEFMKRSADTLENIPDTWKQYCESKEGAIGIIDMEYRELKKAANMEALEHELVHIASACLYAWRKMRDGE